MLTKGGGIVILDKASYLEEAYNFFSDTNYYTHLETDPSASFCTSYSDLISLAYQGGILNKKEK